MKKKTIIGLFVIIGFLFFLTSNSHARWNDLSSIVSPNWFEELNSYPVEIVVQLEDGANEKTFKARLNGKNITDRFVYDSTENTMTATVSHDDGLKIIERGEHGWWRKTNILKTKVRGSKRKRDVDFRSFYVKVDVMETIGSEGGMIEDTDPESPFYQMKIFVPAGTVEEATIFTISKTNKPAVPLPDGVIQDGSMISFQASEELLKPVVVDVPFSGDLFEDEIRLFFHFNEATQSWEPVTPLPTDNPSKMKALLPNFSTYTKGRVQVGSSFIYSGFSMGADALAAENNRPGCIYDSGKQQDKGICAGMSLVAESYFNRYAEQNGEGLRCWWTEDTSWDVSCRAHGLYNGQQEGWVDGFYSLLVGIGVIIDYPIDDSYLIDYLKFKLLLNQTTSIAMLGLEIPLIGHSILVIGWEKNGPFSGRFIVYDNQDNDSTREIEYFRSGIFTIMDYQDTVGNDYDVFAQTVSLYLSYPLIYNLIENTPGEDACEAGLRIVSENNTYFLVWLANEQAAGYRVFYREEGQSYDFDFPYWEGSETTCGLYGLNDNTTYYFSVRYYDEYGNEYIYGNEVSFAW